ncbi:heavy-metal-associated domain-containing protein [Roseateles puraquae]|jgi:copper chaperone|uniref:Heavy metal transporter n=1 Tax=Roseateles puraquae TaxID=431059 RepID=A0A254MZW9_9BURK|nr:heavy-metal-associated domain-containing protein [Roseateles puraquae]MDG0855803.1 copper chaperone [Roseateles puraquae]OWQ99947.1 heavy metal transporter [Roseateles puraquae]
MITFVVSDMTCGHCASTITKALKGTDPDARVEIDVAAHRVQVEPVAADTGELMDAIKAAGYSPILAAQPAEVPATAGRKGCCGG